jgi:cephalosporin-C deacetylase-like acetyl esterase
MLGGCRYSVSHNFRDRLGRPMTGMRHCPTLVNIGMRDAVCPTSMIMPVFACITAPKALHVYPDLTHIPCTDFNAHAMHWLRRYLGA